MLLRCMAGYYWVLAVWLIVVTCVVGVAGIKSLACPVASRHSCQPNGLSWVQRSSAPPVGVDVHGELAPTPGILVG
jgi:hypothetical protein